MAYSEQVLRQAQARLAQERSQCEAEAEARVRQIYAQFPRLQEIDRLLRQSVAHAVALSMRHGEDPRAAIDALREKNLALQQEREWILEANDLEESALEPAVICAKCGGSGYVGSSMCECLQELCRQEQKKELSSLLSGKETFDSFHLDYYPDETDPESRVNPRLLMQNTFQHCKRYAKTFTSQSPSLLFSGGPGLGKTFLSACIARTVADSGFSVVYDTAGKLFSDFETVKFGGSRTDLTKKYLTCDLLIVDDLGTEMTTQFTQAVLYQVINSRLMENRPVIISTNLNPDGIRQRYAPAIASRLLGAYQLCMFLGRDIRQLRR